ncbi:CLUMA_CG012504, isoform A [Clunio marinus]|uniref:Metalloendopeptidase n=1 Tax=Clunio marinus TaxID=568069 RepID=A0A1J1IJB3_9DIPT|nr:CLUMA_CG012504, isoform A [Clunio marinus]
MLTCLLLIASNFVNIFGSKLISGLQIVPPQVKYGINPDAFNSHGNEYFSNYVQYNDDDEGFIWEKSGLYEGDIMTYSNEIRNGILNETLRWPNATIPFYIEEDHFSDDELLVIMSAMLEYHEKTCLRFKPYNSKDENWVVVTGNREGCWSSVGMQNEGGQQLNVNSPKCVKKGTVIHEFLHAAGFAHQHSSSNRDDYIEIVWENILDGHESNFKKYNKSIVTDYGTSYDYESIMHYSRKAFSKNGNDTIIPLRNVTQLGQRDKFSLNDVYKLNRMYNASCHKPETESKERESNTDFESTIKWFETLFN